MFARFRIWTLAALPGLLTALTMASAHAALSLAPSGPIDFGTAAAGQTAVKILTVTNSGPMPAFPKIVDLPAGAFTQANNCPQMVAVNAGCQIKLTFAPTPNDPIGTTIKAQLMINADIAVPGSPVTLAGTPVAAATSSTGSAILTFSPAGPMDFGTVKAGEMATKTLTLSNTGNADASISSFGGLTAPFGFINNCTSTLKAGASCNLTIGFAPKLSDVASGSSSVGTLAAFASVSVSGSPYRVTGVAALNSTSGGSAMLALSPLGPLDFGNVKVGETQTRSLTLSNMGTSDAVLGDLPGLPAPFSLGNGCPTVLRAGASCMLTIGFTPRAADASSGAPSTFTLTAPANVSVTGSPYTLKGTALASTTTGVAALVLSPPGPFDFGPVLAGQGAIKVLQLSNTGGSDAHISALSGLAAPFGVKSNCVGTLPPGGNCMLAVGYNPAPSDTATAKGTLTISADTSISGSPYVLTGTPAAPGAVGLGIAPMGPFNFGPVQVGASSSTTLTLRNSGNTPATISSIGTLAAPFSLTPNCPATLAPGENCTLLVKYSPTSANATGGDSKAQINIASNPPALGTPYDVIGTPQTGTPTLSVTPIGPYDFGSIPVGQSGSKVFTLTNAGPGAAALKGVGILPPYFVTTTCSSILAAQASCTYTVEYRPGPPELLIGKSPKAQLFIGASSAVSGAPVDLSGTAAAGSATLTLNPPGPFAFGPVKVGEIGNRVIVLSNNGGNAVAINGFVGLSKPFSLKHNCPNSLDAGKVCQLSVSYTPTSDDLTTSSASAQLTVAAGVSVTGSPYTFSSTPRAGDALAPALTLNPSGPYAFGTVAAGAVSTTTLTLTNNGKGPAQITGFTGLSNPFSSVANCPTFLRVGESCSIKVSFAPINTDATAGTASGELNVIANVPVTGSPFAVTGGATASSSVETPTTFTFNAAKGVPLGSTVQSNVVTLSGITKAVLVQVSNGQYSINGRAFTSDAGAARPGDTLQVRLTSSSDYNVATTATLTVGGVAADFVATTLIKSFTIGGDGISASNVVVQPTGETTSQSLNLEVTLADVTANTLSASSAPVGRFAASDASYKVYLAGLIPGGTLGTTAATIYLKDITANWVLPGSPLSAYLENVQLYSQDTAVKIDVLQDFDFGVISGTEFYIGYGLTDTEMLSSGRYRAFYRVP